MQNCTPYIEFFLFSNNGNKLFLENYICGIRNVRNDNLWQTDLIKLQTKITRIIYNPSKEQTLV